MRAGLKNLNLDWRVAGFSDATETESAHSSSHLPENRSAFRLRCSQTIFLQCSIQWWVFQLVESELFMGKLWPWRNSDLSPAGGSGTPTLNSGFLGRIRF
jgi:hypothetical protein